MLLMFENVVGGFKQQDDSHTSIFPLASEI